MDEKISKLFLPLLDKLYNTEPAGEPFRKPVDPIKYGCTDYYLYVKHPIDLSTIRDKLLANQYTDAWQFVADIQLMFSNAYLFNKKGTPVYEYTNKLNKIWNSELTPIMQRLNYCCGTLHKFGAQLLFCHGTTPEKYCQINIGAKYKCYQDSYSFCMPCFNKYETDYITIEGLTCETARKKLPTQPVKKSDFIDCTNDKWQYENFIQCTKCTRRVHQICELYPADKDEIERCAQHPQIEEERKTLCKVLPEFEKFTQALPIAPLPPPPSTTTTTTSHNISIETTTATATATTTTTTTSNTTKASVSVNLNETTQSVSNEEGLDFSDESSCSSALEQTQPALLKCKRESGEENVSGELKNNPTIGVTNIACNSTKIGGDTALDAELMHLARDVDDNSVDWLPHSPTRLESINKSLLQAINSGNSTPTRSNSAHTICNASTSIKQSVDTIAARLSISKLNNESQVEDFQKSDGLGSQRGDKFVCNHCYRTKKLGFDLRHRKYSARRLPHTRMSRYIETKVNEYIRENSPTAGEMIVRVLTAYRDTVEVKPAMMEYLKLCRVKNSSQHSNLEEYPEQFDYTTRAIFAWQEIDGVDVCVFGMHVQEYGEDCPEPNRQVVYLSYLDSVHFFRPKQFRTAVYHEILLSYFKYVKKLGFRRVFIWVCPSRKGDDYIFYRHPTEQKMPTLKRLSDWYVHLLDKGVVSGIVERHHNIYECAQTENWSSLLSMPYLSGDYWPGEFERLLNLMIESQKKYEENKLQRHQQYEKDDEMDLDHSPSGRYKDILEFSQSSQTINGGSINGTNPIERSLEQYNVLSLSNLYQRPQPPTSSFGKICNTTKNSMSSKQNSKDNISITNEFDWTTFNNHIKTVPEDCKPFELFTPSSTRSEDQPLDLSKSSANTSPESYYDDDLESEYSYKEANVSARKKRRKSASTMGYTKKRCRASSQFSSQNSKAKLSQTSLSVYDNPSKHFGKSTKICRKSSTQTNKDAHNSENLLHPEEQLIKELEKSLKRQKDGFIVVKLNDCDCSPHFESQRRKEEIDFSCELMKGREPFLQLARVNNYEFSTLRRAKFSSLAMVKHLGESFNLDPICHQCFSFDSSKRHYACQICRDYYLCTSCHENTQHEHIMSIMSPITLPEIDEFMQQCQLASGSNSISSASSTISNKSFNESTSLEQSFESTTSSIKKDYPTPAIANSVLLYSSNSLGSSGASMPLSCKRQRNRGLSTSDSQIGNEENAHISPFAADTHLLNIPTKQPSPPPSHSSDNPRQVHVEFDQVMIESFIRHAEVSYNVDFDEMKSESKKLLTHYPSCPIKDTCGRCRFVVLSCSFMSVLMRSTRMQMMLNCDQNEPGQLQSNGTGGTSATHPSGVNLTTTPRFKKSYHQTKD